MSYYSARIKAGERPDVVLQAIRTGSPTPASDALDLVNAGLVDRAAAVAALGRGPNLEAHAKQEAAFEAANDI